MNSDQDFHLKTNIRLPTEANGLQKKTQNLGDWSCKFVVNLETLVTLKYLPSIFTCLRVDFSMQGIGEGGWG